MSLDRALKDLRRIGASKATGEALAAAYAQVVQQHCALGKAAITPLFEHLLKVPDGELLAEMRRLLNDPFAAVTIALAHEPSIRRGPKPRRRTEPKA